SRKLFGSFRIGEPVGALSQKAGGIGRVQTLVKIQIAPGVEGLIHVSEMSWSQHLRSAQDFMKVGDEVEAVILTLDRDERKMSLGIK
ncbi:S1 RNA-binding domain-containing protein, partial [Escherichia coli]|nr:S1 RNA-binding domain-containing protein [Escherichia coli]